MKIRSGFVSNSSTASFIVKTKPTEWDKLFHKEETIRVMPSTEIEFLKKCGFIPTNSTNPFEKELTTQFGDPEEKPETEDDTLLRLWMVCNHDYGLRFLVANNISFKASIHYGHHLYSYDRDDAYIYVLNNFGMEYLNHPKKLEDELNDPEMDWVDGKPFRKIKVSKYLKGYDEKEAISIMTGEWLKS